MKKSLLLSALSVLAFSLTGAQATAGWWFNCKDCKKKGIQQYNAFSPRCMPCPVAPEGMPPVEHPIMWGSERMIPYGGASPVPAPGSSAPPQFQPPAPKPLPEGARTAVPGMPGFGQPNFNAFRSGYSPVFVPYPATPR